MIWAAVVAGVFSVITTVVGLINRRRLGEIHILVNNRLDLALQEIKDLKEELKK